MHRSALGPPADGDRRPRPPADHGATNKPPYPAGVFTHYTIPKDLRHGTGFWGAARGYLSHHLTIEDQVMQSYQILGPSTFTMSPRDGSGHPGPCEAAVVATPLLSTANPERCVDVLRAIRSFNPSMACATH